MSESSLRCSARLRDTAGLGTRSAQAVSLRTVPGAQWQAPEGLAFPPRVVVPRSSRLRISPWPLEPHVHPPAQVI